MSANLMFEPIIERGKNLSDELRFAFEKSWNLADGEKILTESDLLYLRGIRDGGIKEAQKLIDAITKYGEVKIWLES